MLLMSSPVRAVLCLSNYLQNLFWQLGEGDNRGLERIVRANNFFHPYHIVPAVKFIAALMKLAHHPVAKVCMKLYAVFGQIFVFNFGIADTGVKVKNVLCLGNFFQNFVKSFSQTHLFAVFTDINGRFRCPCIGCPPDERACVGITKDFSLNFGN